MQRGGGAGGTQGAMPLPPNLLPATTDGPGATVALGRRIGAALAPGEVVALVGDLGAGKTHLVKGIVAGMGGDAGAVTSPTFTLVHTYQTPRGRVHHIDAYRIERPADFAEIGGDEVLGDEAAIVLVEWPGRIAAALPAETIRIEIDHAGGDHRRITRAAPAGHAPAHLRPPPTPPSVP